MVRLRHRRISHGTMCFVAQPLFNSNNFADSAALAEVCALYTQCHSS